MNKNLELVLRTLVYNTVVPGGHWSSSAKNYQDFLTARGIHLPIKLFHEYKYPNNVTPSADIVFLLYVRCWAYNQSPRVCGIYDSRDGTDGTGR